jgi:hypothetical protein
MTVRRTLGVLLVMLATSTGCGQSSAPTSPTADCSYVVGPPAQSVEAGGGSFRASVTTTAAGCGWSASSNSLWIIVSSGLSGTGSGEITYSVLENPDTARAGAIVVGLDGRSLTVVVTQDGTIH